MIDVAPFREAVGNWATRLNAEYFAFGSGRKPTLDTQPIYADHAAWFTAEQLRAWDAAWSGGGDAHAHVLRRGLVWTAQGYLDTTVQDLTTELAEREARLTVEWDGAEVSLFSAQPLLATEPSPARRRDLYERCMAALATLEPLRDARLRARHAAARAAGFASYRALHERVLGLELDSLHARLERLLPATGDTYHRQLSAFLVEHAGTSLDKAHRADTMFLTAFTVPGADFPSGALIAALDRTLINLGLAPLTELPITLDLEARPAKQARAFCSGIDIPHDVRLCHAPVGGIEDYAVTFHEMGHALHFAHARDTLPPEDRYVGDRGLTETYAFLVQGFVTTPGWLHEVLDIRDPAPIVAHARLAKTYMLRRYVAKLGYELALHALPPDGALEPLRVEYARRLSAATGFETDGRGALRDVDDGFYCADYLRAWCADAQIRTRFADQFGPGWYRAPAVGALLRAWWAEGSKWTADDLAAAAGVGVIRPDALIAELRGDA